MRRPEFSVLKSGQIGRLLGSKNEQNSLPKRLEYSLAYNTHKLNRQQIHDAVALLGGVR